ncbi:hypothetical protein BS78_02G298800 [Paspalum vaginatum]|nr:hypothetical protein BS78_02G298800 [Paspalum vaginatum]KAJ1291185.1 hypothetical protein BS78_02G298800 [Paspalum vaginatum]
MSTAPARLAPPFALATWRRPRPCPRPGWQRMWIPRCPWLEKGVKQVGSSSPPPFTPMPARRRSFLTRSDSPRRRRCSVVSQTAPPRLVMRWTAAKTRSPLHPQSPLRQCPLSTWRSPSAPAVATELPVNALPLPDANCRGMQLSFKAIISTIYWLVPCKWEAHPVSIGPTAYGSLLHLPAN